jgi:tRNA(Ile)-lysidine synthase TilS/MesJ
LDFTFTLVESIDRPVDRYSAETRLLLAMSGGQDSMALFSLLPRKEAKKMQGHSLLV